MTPRRDRSWRPSSAPPWWPQGEPWPPQGPRWFRDRRRERFLRRSGWYSFLPLWALLWLFGSLLRGQLTSGRISPLVVVLLASAAAAATVAVIIRRIASPLADLVSASDRIARRDYRVRVAEPGHGPGWVRDTARAFNAMAQELESQDDARRHLMADIAHELRTPLSVVQGRIEGLIDGVYPRDAVELQALLDDTRLVARLVEDLRTLSSAESGALGLVREPTDIVALATDVVSAFVPRASEAGVALAIHANVPPETRPISLDPVRIKEVLNNLIVNALRYTPAAGRVDVYVSASASAIAIRVVDTGPGIAPDDLLRIFDRFFKGAGSSGSGLGLTIARRLVEAHGGTLRAESEPGRGTTMIVDLPVTGETHG